MSKLYFKYGTMGSSKSAQALMCKFNYEQKGLRVLLMKPATDTRDNEDGESYVKTRIGLKAKCSTFSKLDSFLDIIEKTEKQKRIDCVIIDEAQFCTKKQIDELKEISGRIPVLCYGLKTDFRTEFFEGSKRLMEIADSLMEIKQVCSCGRKAEVNARLVNGKVVTEGETIFIGGDESYESMCYWCYKKRIENQ
ncbi:MAG: thymidine kinase [Clostridia bacterium]